MGFADGLVDGLAEMKTLVARGEEIEGKDGQGRGGGRSHGWIDCW